jgi:hypothetical protein
MFLEELPEDDIEPIDVSSSAGNFSGAANTWRANTTQASQGWYDTGFSKTSTKQKEPPIASNAAGDYDVGVMVHHDVYGVGRITDVSGHGVMRKLKIQFSVGGSRTFLADKAKLAVVQQG